MKTKIIYVEIFFLCLIAIGTLGCSTQETGQPQTISPAERALAMWEVQNTMSKHDY